MFKIPHFPVEGSKIKDILEMNDSVNNYRRYSQNCRNCGASSIINGNCAYCNTKY